jgi:hypothetical protein
LKTNISLLRFRVSEFTEQPGVKIAGVLALIFILCEGLGSIGHWVGTHQSTAVSVGGIGSQAAHGRPELQPKTTPSP